MKQRPNSVWSWVWLAVFVSLFGAIGISILLFPDPPRIDIANASPRAGPDDTSVAYAANSIPIEPIPREIVLDPVKVVLGERLFHDARLSRDGAVSCAHCHDLAKAGTDRQPVSVGIDGRKGVRNAPSVFNAAFNFRQFWDGRAADLIEQVDGPLHDPDEMDSNWPDVIARLKDSGDYARDFKTRYPEGLTEANIKDALAIYQRSLYTPDSRFDRFLRGERGALTEVESRGLRLFLDLGCVRCHQGVGIGGNMFQRMGAKNVYFGQNPAAEQVPDYGRYAVTGVEADRFRFKVPGLRNVAVTPPYFHDGSVQTLEDAVTVMARYQLARELSEQERTAIVAFLATLTGQYRGKSL